MNKEETIKTLTSAYRRELNRFKIFKSIYEDSKPVGIINGFQVLEIEHKLNLLQKNIESYSDETVPKRYEDRYLSNAILIGKKINRKLNKLIEVLDRDGK